MEGIEWGAMKEMKGEEMVREGGKEETKKEKG